MNESDIEAATKAFASFCRTVATLRDPVHGCPWDLEQDHRSLRAYMLEEAYEAVACMEGRATPELCEELGDVLLQVVLNAQLAWDEKAFAIADVIAGIDAKMRRRHPHVFGSDDERARRDIPSIKKTWQEIKQAEKAQLSAQAAAPEGFFEREGVQRVHPATTQAQKIGKVAARLNFDWSDVSAVWDKFASEVEELRHELPRKGKVQEADKRLEDELGDVYFSLAQLCRHLGKEPELMAQQGNEKFLKRFAKVEALARAEGIMLEGATQEQLERLWIEAKKNQKNTAK